MKRMIWIFLALILCLSVAVPVLAAGSPLGMGMAVYPRLVDNADLLTGGEEGELLELLDEISLRQQLDVVVVTTDTLYGKSPMAYADDFFDDNAYGFGPDRDGILLLVSMEDRDWWISTSGFGITALTDAGIEHISDLFLSDLSDGFYADAFRVYARQCDAFITQARTGDPYDVHNMPREPFEPGLTFVMCLFFGFLIGLIVSLILRGQLKSVRKQSAAAVYIKRGSLRLTQADEFFLYSNVTKTRKANTSGGSSVHRSSSGRSHGGGGGKF